MKIKELTSKQIELLKSPLPPEAITQHPTKSFLSSIKPAYVIERLNDVFGIGSWTTDIDTISVDYETGMVVVKMTFEIPEYGIKHQSFGGNNNGGIEKRGFDLGDAYKGASTDALTKISSYLEIGNQVFKGLVDAPNNQPKNDNRPWFNETEFKQVKARVDKGEPIELETILAHYKVSKAMKEKLKGIKVT